MSICPTKLFNFTKFLPVKLAPILQWDGVRKICIRLAKTNLLPLPEPTEFIGKWGENNCPNCFHRKQTKPWNMVEF